MEYKVKDCVLKSIYSDAFEIANADIPWENLAGSTVLITGGGGFIGGYLTLALLTRNDVYGSNIRVISLVRNAVRAEKKFGKLLSRDDFSLCVQDVNEEIQAERADYIIHAASPASPLIMKDQPVETVAANTLGTFYTLVLAKEKGAQGYLYISSREIYGQPAPDQEFFYEDTYGFVDPLNPRSCYPEGKKAAETMCVSFRAEYGVNAKIARLAHTYGPFMSIYDGRVQADFLRNVLNKENIVLKSEGTAVRTYTYISDAMDGLFRTLLNAEDVVCNIGDENGKVSIRELAELLVKMHPEDKLRLVFDIPEGGTKGTAPFTAGILSSARLRSLGWKPRYTVEQGFARTLHFLEIEKSEGRI